MKKHRMQLIFGLPILFFAIYALLFSELDRAFLGGLIGAFMSYFFRKAVPPE